MPTAGINATDALTGVGNYDAFVAAFEQCLGATAGETGSLSLGLVDQERVFKQFLALPL